MTLSRVDISDWQFESHDLLWCTQSVLYCNFLILKWLLLLDLFFKKRFFFVSIKVWKAFLDISIQVSWGVWFTKLPQLLPHNHSYRSSSWKGRTSFTHTNCLLKMVNSVHWTVQKESRVFINVHVAKWVYQKFQFGSAGTINNKWNKLNPHVLMAHLTDNPLNLNRLWYQGSKPFHLFVNSPPFSIMNMLKTSF